MIVVLDTNHFSEVARRSKYGEILKRRSIERGATVFTTIITAQESAEGWFCLINRVPAGRRQVGAYHQYQHSLTLLHRLDVLPFDDDAADQFEALQSYRLRIGTMDLKIASICLAHDAVLLTRNQADFNHVPKLRHENWLD